MTKAKVINIEKLRIRSIRRRNYEMSGQRDSNKRKRVWTCGGLCIF